MTTIQCSICTMTTLQCSVSATTTMECSVCDRNPEILCVHRQACYALCLQWQLCNLCVQCTTLQCFVCTMYTLAIFWVYIVQPYNALCVPCTTVQYNLFVWRKESMSDRLVACDRRGWRKRTSTVRLTARFFLRAWCQWTQLTSMVVSAHSLRSQTIMTNVEDDV